MSARKLVLSLTAEAQQDLEDIVLYSAAIWGEGQAVRCGQVFRNAFVLLLSQPFIGVAQQELSTGLRSRLVEHHIIYYLVTEYSLEVVRILHERVNPALHIEK